nr:OpgC domain-containing protein [Chloroflexota bacterium]
PFTGANRFVVSAAEGFVFLAGLVVGMVYGGRMRREGWRVACEGLLHRAAVLYAVTTGLTLLFVVLFQYTDLRLWLDRAYGLGLNDPVELVVSTLTLHYTYHGTDILWLYTILLAVAPFVLVLLRYGQIVAVLGASWVLWYAYQQAPQAAAIPWAATNVNYFPVAPWQLLFVHGIVLGFHRQAIGRVLGRIPAPFYLVVFGLGMAFLVLMHRAHDTGRLAGWPILGWLAGEEYLVVFDKTSVPPGRILAFVVLAGFSYSLVTVFWVPIRAALGWLLLKLGTNSLRAYCLHLVLIVLVYNVDSLARMYDRSRWANTVLQGLTVGLTFAIIIGWERLEPGLAWRPSLPLSLALARRHPLLFSSVSAALLLVTVGGAFFAGSVRASRQTDLASATTEAGVLRYIPPDGRSQVPPTLLLALHGEGESGPEFAAPLIDVARNNGWALLAPTISWGDRSDIESISSLVAETLPAIQGLVDAIGDAGNPVQSRIVVFGGSRGAHTARLFALFYPDAVAAVATVGPAPCLLPTEELGGDPLPVPVGLGDLDQYVGEPFNREAIAQTAFWIGIPLGAEVRDGGCPWGALGDHQPEERAQIFSDLLAAHGVRTRIVTASGPDAPERLRGEALHFLRASDPRNR